MYSGLLKIVWGGLIFAVVLSVPAEASDHRLLTEVLSEHVDQEGLVDYPALCDDSRLDEYLKFLEGTDPNTLSSRDAQIAFWINAYNAYMLKAVCDRYPVKSVNDLHTGGLLIGSVLGKTIWDRPLAGVNGRDLTLNAIEHQILRTNYEEPRIHFALVCAALSCPPLRTEAYTGSRLDAQLNEQARRFLNNREKNTFNPSARTAVISKIFSWFAEDFGDSQSEILSYLSTFLPEDTARSIRKDPSGWSVRYQHYDWTLNDRAQSQ